MNNGVLVSGLVNVAFGSYFIYLAKNKKEKLGRKAKFVTILGIGIIILAVINAMYGWG